MNASETEGLRNLMCKIQPDGKTVLLIEHDVKLVMGPCDRLAMLAARSPTAQVQKDPRVIGTYLGLEEEV